MKFFIFFLFLLPISLMAQNKKEKMPNSETTGRKRDRNAPALCKAQGILSKFSNKRLDNEIL